MELSKEEKKLLVWIPRGSHHVHSGLQPVLDQLKFKKLAKIETGEFYDTVHLTPEGVEIYNQVLRERFAELKPLIDTLWEKIYTANLTIKEISLEWYNALTIEGQDATHCEPILRNLGFEEREADRSGVYYNKDGLDIRLWGPNCGWY